MKSLIQNQKGTTLLITLLILSSILVVALISSDIVLSGLKAGLGRQDSTKAYFAAESGIERILYEVKNDGFDYDSCDSASIDECDNVASTLNCSNCSIIQSIFLTNGSKYRIKYASSTPNIYFTSFGSYRDVSRAVAVGFSSSGSTIDCGEDVDYEGEIYPTVQIGTQCWMAKNLNVGTMIPGIQDMANFDGDLDGIDDIEKYCYGDSNVNCITYGGLYQWNEAMQYVTTSGAQGICPPGWHIPTDEEWHILENHFATGVCDPNRWNAWGCDPAGTALNSGGLSNFNVLPAGYSHTGGFALIGTYAYFWSSSVSNLNAWMRLLSPSNSSVYRDERDQTGGHSIRCIKN